MKVTACTAGDADAVHALECSEMSRPWSKVSILSAIESRHSVIYKAEDEHGFLGYAGMECVDGAEASVYNIVVAREHRRKGVASALLEKLIDRCKELRISSLWLEVWEGNTAAKNLYTKYGFGSVYTRKNYYPEGDAIVMTLSLRRDD